MTRDEMISAIETVLQDWIPSDAMSNHDVLSLAARISDKLAHLTLSAEEREIIAWLKQLLGSIAYRVEPRRGPALDLLNRLLGATP